MRKMVLVGIALLFVGGGLWMACARGDDAAPAAAKAEAEKAPVQHGYIGPASCQGCHKSAAKGDQYGKWKAGPHAQAYNTLLNEESIKIAKEKGLKVPPSEAPECLKCHETAYNVKPELLGAKFNKTEGVGCESCHGPAADWKLVHMKDVKKAMTLGMIVPDKAVCVQCHNEESPTFKGFDYEKALAVIAHPNPQKAKKE